MMIIFNNFKALESKERTTFNLNFYVALKELEMIYSFSILDKPVVIYVDRAEEISKSIST